MEGTFFYLQDEVSSAPSISSQFMSCANLSYSSFPYCHLSEVIAPYQNITSTDPASQTATDVKSDSVSSILDDHKIQHQLNNSHNRIRKVKDGSSCLTSSECKDSRGRRKKQKREEENKRKEEMNAKLEAQPNGYIHVRSRRGQATDSHSLAERVRREKISERMKMLQSLVPGCDMVTGKAHMLDEIINYVQSLQNQIEFLSMKLASMDPCAFVECIVDQDETIGGMTHEQVPYGELDQANISNNNGPTHSNIDCLFIEPPLLLQPQELNSITTFSQNGGSAMLVQLDQPGQDLLNQLGFGNTFGSTF